MRLKACIVSLAAALAFGSTLPAAADAYKWIDGNGVTHYSQLPPLKGPYTVVKTQSGDSISDSPSAATGSTTQTPEDTSQNGPKRVDRNEIPDLKQRCQIARKDVTTLQMPVRIRIVKSDGSVGWMSDAQRAQHLKEAKSFIAQYCS